MYSSPWSEAESCNEVRTNKKLFKICILERSKTGS